MEPLIEQIQNPPTEVEFPVAVEWLQKHQFRARDDNDHSVTIDTALDDGGDGLGMSPIRLLTAVAGCSSIDIVDILRKSRQDLIGLTVSARGIQNEEYPHYLRRSIFFTRLGETTWTNLGWNGRSD